MEKKKSSMHDVRCYLAIFWVPLFFFNENQIPKQVKEEKT